MDKGSLNKFYDRLVGNLWDEFLFFFPVNQIPKEILDELKFLETQDINNKVLVIDKEKGPMFYKTSRNPVKAISKGAKLDANIFGLLERKKSCEPFEFNYVLEKYFEQVEFLFYISTWMNSNMDQAEPVDKPVLGLFNIQFSNYRKHFKALVKYFYPKRSDLPSGNFNVKQLIDTHFPDVIKRFNSEDNTNPVNRVEDRKEAAEPSPGVDNQMAPSKSKNKKRIPLVSETDAERILLKAYFNIDVK